MQEHEQRMRELREKLANAKMQNAQGLDGDADTIFAPIPDYVERRRPIVRLFFSVYDNVGTLMVINFFTFVLTLPLLVVLLMMNGAAMHHQNAAILLPLLVVGLLAPPAWGAASSYCAKIVEMEMTAWRDYWTEYRRLFARSILLALAQWIAGFILIYATGWYLGQGSPAIKIVGVISLYLFLFWALLGLYIWPLMVRGYRPRAILRNATVLVLAAPLRSIGILFVLVVLTVILGLTGIGIVLLLFGLWAMLPNQALVLTRERLEQRAAARQQASATEG